MSFGAKPCPLSARTLAFSNSLKQLHRMACQVATKLVVVAAWDLMNCPDTLHQQADDLKLIASSPRVRLPLASFIRQV
jgi:hypothetical protein